MHSKRNIIGLSTAVVLVLLVVVVTTIYQKPAESSFSAFTAALTRGVKAGSARATAKSAAAAVSPLSLPAYGFKISTPASWQVKQDPQAGGVTNVFFGSEPDNFIMVVTLATNTGTKPVKLSELVSATVAAIPSETQFKVVKTENGKVAGSPTKVLTVTQKADDGTLLKGQQIFLIKGKTLCVFFFTNVPEKYDQSLRLFNNTLKTVTLK